MVFQCPGNRTGELVVSFRAGVVQHRLGGRNEPVSNLIGVLNSERLVAVEVIGERTACQSEEGCGCGMFRGGLRQCLGRSGQLAKVMQGQTPLQQGDDALGSRQALRG